MQIIICSVLFPLVSKLSLFELVNALKKRDFGIFGNKKGFIWLLIGNNASCAAKVDLYFSVPSILISLCLRRSECVHRFICICKMPKLPEES